MTYDKISTIGTAFSSKFRCDASQYSGCGSQITLGLQVSPLAFFSVRRSPSNVTTSSGLYGGETCRYSEPNNGVSSSD